jgi:2-phospho-L-lactate guanylyltransferase
MRAALIPMKELSQAKMRLADVLDQRERSELALAMLTDVITACNDSACFDIVAVVSTDSEVFWHARDLGAKPVAEPGTLGGLNDSLTFGQRYLARRVAATELTILPADIPLVRPEDIAAVVVALGDGDERRAVVVRAPDGGTNALALRPPEAIPMHYGADSARAHIDAARGAGLDVIELDLDRLAFDLDAPDDLIDLGSRPLGAATAGWCEARAHYAAG